jgi:hypothetical protein
MAVPHNKDELLASLSKQHDRLIKVLHQIPPDCIHSLQIEGHINHTYISLSDLLAYLMGWNKLVLKWIVCKHHNLPVDFPETGYKWNEQGRLAQSFYAQYHTLRYDDLLVQFEQSHQALVLQVQAHSQRELYVVPWYHQWVMGRLIHIHTAAHYDNARGRVRKAIKIQRLMQAADAAVER